MSKYLNLHKAQDGPISIYQIEEKVRTFKVNRAGFTTPLDADSISSVDEFYKWTLSWQW